MTVSFDGVAETTARRAANGLSRRSLLGRVGIGLAAIGAGSLGVAAREARASTLSCGCAVCGNSTSCGVGACPAGSCNCGAWYMCECSSGTRLRSYQDCCSSCPTAGCGADGRPTCLYSAPYGTCSGYTKVKCRVITCTQLPCD